MKTASHTGAQKPKARWRACSARTSAGRPRCAGPDCRLSRRRSFHAVVVGHVQPLPQIGLRHPAPPADLKPKVEIVLIDREHGIDHGQPTQRTRVCPDKDRSSQVLQRVVKAIIPVVQDHIDSDDRQFDPNHRAEQEATGPARLSERKSEMAKRHMVASVAMRRFTEDLRR